MTYLIQARHHTQTDWLPLTEHADADYASGNAEKDMRHESEAAAIAWVAELEGANPEYRFRVVEVAR